MSAEGKFDPRRPLRRTTLGAPDEQIAPPGLPWARAIRWRHPCTAQTARGPRRVEMTPRWHHSAERGGSASSILALGGTLDPIRKVAVKGYMGGAAASRRGSGSRRFRPRFGSGTAINLPRQAGRASSTKRKRLAALRPPGWLVKVLSLLGSERHSLSSRDLACNERARP